MLVYLVSFYPTKWLRNFAGAPNFSPQKLTMFLFGCPVLSIPHNDTLVYLVPPARSRYCASPEASIPLNPLNPLNSASTLGATASAPTSRRQPTTHYALRTNTNRAQHSTDAQRRQLRTKHYALICPSPVRHTVYEG